MFLLRRRVPSIPRSTLSDFVDSNSVDSLTGSSLDCSTPGVKRSKFDQTLSTQRPNTISRSRALRRRLSENEKARISIYIRLLDAMFAFLIATMKLFGKHFLSAVDLVKAKGASEVLYLMAAVTMTVALLVVSFGLYIIVSLHQALVLFTSTFQLVEIPRFSLHAYPPVSPSFQTRRRASLIASMASSRRPSISFSQSPADEPAVSGSNGQRIAMDVLPLIDLSSRESEAGDASPEVLKPEVLSPTQIQLRSLSPAFDRSIRDAKESEIAELLSQPSSKPSTPQPPSLAALLSRKGTLGSLMADTYGSGRPMEAGRSMSTISYPDVGDGFSTSDDSSEIGRIKEEPIEEGDENEGSTAAQYNGRTDIEEDDEDYIDDETENPHPDAEVEEIPFTASPGYTHAELASGPETIDVLDPESRRATMDASAPQEEVKFAFPEPMTVPATSVAAASARPSSTSPPSQVVLPAVPNGVAVDSPRDLFSPKPVSFPQPISSLPFAFPFLREQQHQRVSSDSSDSGARWNTYAEVEGQDKKKDEPSVEPTPYPSPPFTPPSTLPPNMYTSMAPALQMPSADANLNPFVTERSQLSALVEEAKAKLESERKEESAQRPTQAPDQDLTVEEPEDNLDSQARQPVAPRFPEPTIIAEPEVTSIPMEVAKPVPVATRVEASPRYTPSWEAAPNKQERTLVSADAEEPLNEVDDAPPEVTNDEIPERPFSPAGAASGADDESAAPKGKTDKPKKKKKTKRPKNKKGVSFDEVPFVIGSEQEGEHDEASDANININPKIPIALALPSPSVSQSIPVPKSFEVEDDEDSEPPVLRQSSNLSTEVARASPVPSRVSKLSDSRRNSILSDSRRNSILSTADEMSDSSSAFPTMPGEFSDKQVDRYARWFARAYRDKSLPTIQILRDQMKECSETELASRLKLGSRSDPTKLSKTLVGEDLGKGVPSGGVVPPVRKGSFRRNTRR